MRLNKSSKGFTLLEVLIAMTLLSIMVVLLFSSLQIAAESWNKGEKKIAEVNEKAVVFQFFKQHLPSIRPLVNDFSEEDTLLSFSGKADTFQFASVFPASASRKGFHLFEVNFDSVEENIKVVLKPFYLNAQDEEWEPEEVVLLENVQKFELLYFDTEESSWQHEWLEKVELPVLVKIKITMLDQSYWPEMIYSLRLSAFDLDSNQNNVEGIPGISGEDL